MERSEWRGMKAEAVGMKAGGVGMGWEATALQEDQIGQG